MVLQSAMKSARKNKNKRRSSVMFRSPPNQSKSPHNTLQNHGNNEAGLPQSINENQVLTTKAVLLVDLMPQLSASLVVNKPIQPTRSFSFFRRSFEIITRMLELYTGVKGPR